MLKEIKLPDLGEGIDSADVSEILVSPGDNVSVDDIILVLESENAWKYHQKIVVCKKRFCRRVML